VPTPETVSLARPRTRRALAEALDLLDQEVLGIAAFSGMVAESMTRGQGRRFLEMGRRIERSLHTLGLIRATLVSPAASEAPMLEALLEIADSLMTYRRRYLSRLQTIPVLDLILIDPDNPRSLAFQIRELSMNIASLPRTEDAPASNLEQAIISQVVDRIAGLDLALLESLGEGGTRGELDRFLRSVETELPILSDALTRTYLTHLQAARQFSRALELEPTPSGSPPPPGTWRERS
jgi:uncharacterized alpha-E superfamily protein